MLSDWPVDRPRTWNRQVNLTMADATLEALRTSVNRGRPWGDPAWVEDAARRLGLQFTLRNTGRPRKASVNE